MIVALGTHNEVKEREVARAAIKVKAGINQSLNGWEAPFSPTEVMLTRINTPETSK
jgi:hypothetical protein